MTVKVHILTASIAIHGPSNDSKFLQVAQMLGIVCTNHQDVIQIADHMGHAFKDGVHGPLE